jgi:hypothetical protein
MGFGKPPPANARSYHPKLIKISADPDRIMRLGIPFKTDLNFAEPSAKKPLPSQNSGHSGSAIPGADPPDPPDPRLVASHFQKAHNKRHRRFPGRQTGGWGVP